VLLLLAALLPGAAPDEDARAALALAAACKPLAAKARGPDLMKPLTAEEGFALARTRPVLFSVGADCAALCPKLRPDIPVAHAKELWGDSAPHLALVYRDARGQWWRSAPVWRSAPGEDEVRRAALDFKARADCPGGGCPK
jgi:hypothetical protein